MSRPGQIAHLARCRSTKSAAQSTPPPCGLPPFNRRRQRSRDRSRRPVERPCPGEHCGRGIRRAGPGRFHLGTATLGLARGFRFRRHRARPPRAGLWIAGCRSSCGTTERGLGARRDGRTGVAHKRSLLSHPHGLFSSGGVAELVFHDGAVQKTRTNGYSHRREVTRPSTATTSTAARDGRRRAVKLGLHLRYPPALTYRPILGQRATIRRCIFRHYSLHPFSKLLPPFPMCPAPPDSEYYGGYAPSRTDRSTVDPARAADPARPASPGPPGDWSPTYPRTGPGRTAGKAPQRGLRATNPSNDLTTQPDRAQPKDPSARCGQTGGFFTPLTAKSRSESNSPSREHFVGG